MPLPTLSQRAHICGYSFIDQFNKQPSTPSKKANPSKKATTPSQSSTEHQQGNTGSPIVKRPSQQGGKSAVKSTIRGTNDPRSPGAAASPISKQTSPSGTPPAFGQLINPFSTSPRAPKSGPVTSKSGNAIAEGYHVVEDEDRIPYTGSGQQGGNRPPPLTPSARKTTVHSRDSSSDRSFVNVTRSEANSPYDDEFDLEGHEANQGRGIVKAMGRAEPGDSDDER